MIKKALIVVGPSVEDTEFAYPYYRLQEEGFIVDVASNGLVEIIAKHGLPIKPTCDIKKVKSVDYDLLIVPGGLESPDRLRQISELLKFIQEFDTNGKLISTICHGSWVLISAGIVKGRKMTCYVGCKHDLINAGAIYEDVNVISDQHIVSAPHFRNNPEWMKETIRVYNKINQS